MFDKIWGRGQTTWATRDSVIYLFNVWTKLGINPSEVKTKRVQYFIKSFIINSTVCFYLPFAFVMSYFVNRNKMDTSRMLTSLQAAMNVFGFPAKLIAVACCLKRLRRAEPVMDILDKSCTAPDEVEKIRHIAMMGNRFVIIFCISYGSYTTTNFLASIAMGQPPYMMYIPFTDWTASFSQFFLHSFMEFILINMVCFHQVVEDVYAVIYIYILRMHMQMLVERVHRLGTDRTKSKDQHYAELVQCIMDHKNLLE